MQMDRAWKVADMHAEIRKELDDQFQRRFAQFDSESLAWLALVPAWTEPLAEACRLPTDELGLAPFLDRASGAGFCTRRASTPTAAGGSFWMPDDVREQILLRLKTDTGFGAARLQQVANRIGHEILKVQDRVKVPPVIARWAELAAHSDKADETVTFLNDRVSHLVEADDTGAASAWIDTGAALATSLGGALRNSVQLGTRRLELVYRKAQNERHLQHFQDRLEQIAAFNRLIDPRATEWALHYLGMGGVGKTMLLRYITARLATNEQTGFPTSRVDFDHLSPDYPVRRPGQLLVELAVDLRSYATSDELERRFNELRRRSDQLLEALSGEPPPENPLANIRRQEFTGLLDAFTDLLVALPRRQGSPIVLILDTCEELSRLPSRAGIQPAVEATFEILNRVHSKVPDVRVILAGRRLLASSGPGWRTDETKRSKTAVQLPAREFMRLHEIRGFDRRESLRFLTEGKKLAIADAVLQSVIDHSRDVGTAAPIVVEGAPEDAETRFNPFDLSLYADWIRDDPGAIDQILSGDTDPYVEMRIVYRLRESAVAPLLPTIVLWQRFDQAMLACAVPDLDPAGVETLFGQIAELEWIDVQQDKDAGTEYLEIDTNLHPRLLAYYREPPRDRALDAAAESVAAPLARLVRARLGQEGPHGLTFEHVNAALASLPPRDGASLWNDLMLHIASRADWSWAQNVTSRLLGEARAVERRPGLRAAVLATLIAAELHGGTGLNLGAPWEEVEHEASRYPDPAVAAWLQLRACAGRIASILRTEPDVPDDLLQRFWTMVETFDPAERGTPERPWAEQLAASLCAAVHAIVERSDLRARRTRLIPDREAVDRFARRLNQAEYPREMSALTRTLLAEVQGLEGRKEHGLFGRDDTLPNDVVPQRWMDWRQPEAFGDHLRLRIWMLTPAPTHHQLQTDGLSASRVRVSLRTIASIDSERFLSLLVQLHLAHSPQVRFTVPPSPRPAKEPTLADLQEADEKAYSAGRESTCRAHDAVPPLFVSLAMAYLAMGDVSRALSLVEARLKTAEASRRDPATVRHAEIARLIISRRTRMPQPGIVDRIQQSRDADLITETLAVAALAGPDLVGTSPPPAVEPGDYRLAHAWWSTRVALTKDAREQLIAPAREVFDRVRLPAEMEELTVPPEVRSAIRLDIEEIRVVERPGSMFSMASNRRAEPPIWRLPDDRSARSALREAALVSDLDLLKLVHNRDDVRSYAEMALQEGELLALRLPERAAPLLLLAASMYGRANDPLGAWMASISAAIAYWHAGNISELRTTLETLTKPAHGGLIANESGVPSLPLSAWEEWDKQNQPGDDADKRRAALLANPQATGGEILRELLGEEHVGDPVPWTGWRMRLSLCRRLAQFDRPSAAESALKPVAARLSREMAAELQPFPEVADAAAGAGKTPAAATPKARGRVTHETALLTIGWLGIPLIFAYLAFTGRLTPGPTSIFHQPPGLLGWLALTVVGAAVTWVAWSLRGGGHGVPFSWVILAFIVFLFGGYWLVGWIAQLILPLEITPVSHFGVFLTLVIGIFLARPITQWAQRLFTSLLAARGRLEVGIGPPMEAGASVVLSLQGHRLSPRGLGPFIDRVGILVDTACPRPSAEPYLESAKRLPKDVQAPLRDFRVALGSRPLVVDLSIRAGDLAASPWEAVLSLTSLDSRIEKDPLHFRRVMSRRTTASRLREISARDPEAGFIGDAMWLSMSQKAWARSGVPGVHRPSQPPSKSAFLHIVGEPVTTTRGVSMALGANRHESNVAQTTTQQVAPSFSLPEIVSADDGFIREALGVIVQMEPGDALSRLTTDREQSGHMRVFASALISRGVERVVTVPSLPAGLAEAVLEVLTPAIVDPGRHSLTDAVARARGRILGWQSLGGGDRSHDESLAEALKELAYDVCLFIGLETPADRSKGDEQWATR